jgi:hypothetical protein
MQQLSAAQRELVDWLVGELAAVDGVAAVLGGSHARGRADAGSDIDLGLLYAERAPFAIAAIRALAARINDTPEPVVTGFYEWGPWVNGGAWLRVRGQRVDLLYRGLDRCAQPSPACTICFARRHSSATDSTHRAIDSRECAAAASGARRCGECGRAATRATATSWGQTATQRRSAG